MSTKLYKIADSLVFLNASNTTTSLKWDDRFSHQQINHQDTGKLRVATGAQHTRDAVKLKNDTFASTTWFLSAEARRAYFGKADQPGVSISKLISELPNLDIIEIDNTISLVCPARDRITVVAFNAQRCGQWQNISALMKSNPVLMDADVVLLNEMDTGMARSSNVHTTRLLALEL